MKMFLGLFLVMVVGLGARVSFADDAMCKYNEFSGTLTHQFDAHEKKRTRGWVPLALSLCKNANGTYAILTHQAVGLGMLSNPPLVTGDYKDSTIRARKIELLISNMENDKEAFDALENDKEIEAVVVGGTSATQITVFRKELGAGRIYSNTLFGGKKQVAP